MVDVGLLSLAFSAGAAAFINPCSFALLPAYLSYFIGRKEEDLESVSILENSLRGIKYGGIATLGFAAVFLSIGALVSLIGAQIKPFISPALLIIGVVLVILGALWVIDKPLMYLPSITKKVKLSKTSFFLFGAAYALSSLACVFPIFIMITFSALSTGGFLSGLLVFLSFTLGMGTLMIIVSLGMALSKKALIEKFEAARKYTTKIAGLILILAGIYLTYYGYSSFF